MGDQVIGHRCRRANAPHGTQTAVGIVLQLRLGASSPAGSPIERTIGNGAWATDQRQGGNTPCGE